MTAESGQPAAPPGRARVGGFIASLRAACGLLATFATLCLASAPSGAWEIAPRIEIGGMYDDNYNLSSVENQVLEVSGLIADAQVVFERVGQVDELTITPRIRATYFPDEEEQDSTDVFLDGTWAHRGERFRSDLRGNYSIETVFESELPGTDFDGDLGDPDAGDTGRVTVRQHRDLFFLREVLAYRYGERATIEGGISYDEARYEEQVIGNRVDYTNFGGYVGWSWSLSPMTEIKVRAIASQFEPDLSTSDSTSYGVAIEWRRVLSETQQMYVRVGSTRTESDQGAGLPSSSETGFSGGAGARWAFEVTNVFLDLTSTFDPSGFGHLVERDQLRFNVIRRLTERLSGTAGARLLREETLGGQGTDDRDYAAASLGLEWRMTRQFALSCEYEYQWQEYENELSDADGNQVTLSIVYEPRRLD